MSSMSKLTLVSISTCANFNPVFTHLRLIFHFAYHIGFAANILSFLLILNSLLNFLWFVLILFLICRMCCRLCFCCWYRALRLLLWIYVIWEWYKLWREILKLRIVFNVSILIGKIVLVWYKIVFSLVCWNSTRKLKLVCDIAKNFSISPVLRILRWAKIHKINLFKFKFDSI